MFHELKCEMILFMYSRLLRMGGRFWSPGCGNVGRDLSSCTRENSSKRLYVGSSVEGEVCVRSEGSCVS